MIRNVLPLDDSTLISTRDLSTLPAIESLRQRMQQMAALESVFAIEYGQSDYTFHPKWGRSEQMGAVKNGSGDELFAHFTPAGCCIIGFAHESAMSPYRTNPPGLWPGMLLSVPADFKSSLDEPAFDIQSTTFVVWRLASDDAWHTDDLEYSADSYGDGSNDLLSRLLMSPIKFAEWLEENYEVDVVADIVTHVFENRPLSSAQLCDLNSNASPATLKAAVTETGYPLE
ncbi:MAG: hypothetical protein NXI28_24575 [bacterium]|nr:hypothetical protein [bacterium]